VVKDKESRQTNVGNFFLMESNCRVRRQSIARRTNGRSERAARQRQRPSDSQYRYGFRPTLRSLLRVRQGGDLRSAERGPGLGAGGLKRDRGHWRGRLSCCHAGRPILTTERASRRSSAVTKKSPGQACAPELRMTGGGRSALVFG